MDEHQTANPVSWKFLNEPIWKWFAFIVGMGLLLNFWHGVLKEID